MKVVNYFKVFASLFLLVLFLFLATLTMVFVNNDSWPGVLICVVAVVVLSLFGRSWTDWANHLGKGQKAFKKSDFVEARKHLHKALRAVERFPRLDPRRGLVLDWLGQIYRAEGRFEEAEPFLQEAVAIQEQLWGPTHTFTLFSLINQANLCLDLAQFDRAREVYQRVLEVRAGKRKPHHVDFGILNNNLGKSFSDEERYAEAEPYFRRALEIFQYKRKATHPLVGLGLNNLAYCLARQGKVAEAEPLAEQAFAIITKKHDPSPLYTIAHFNLGRVRLLQGRLGEAEHLTRAGLTSAEHIYHRQHPALADGLSLLAEVLEGQHKLPEAETVAQQVLEIRQIALVPNHPARARAVRELAGITRRREPGDPDALDEKVREMR